MAYCRMSEDSDIYLIRNLGDSWTCIGCKLGSDWALYSEQEAISHLLAHREAGHKVPQGALNRLSREIHEGV